MANSNSLSHHLLLPLAGDFSDDVFEPSSSSSSAISFPSFWPPFPSLLSDSDSSDAPFPPDRCAPARRGTAASFLGLDFHDDVWAPPPDEGGEVGGLPLCWDCLQLEEHDQRWDLGLSDADEWEQVAGRGEEDEAAEGAAAVRSLDWEVLLAANSLGSLVIDDDGGGGDIDTFLFHDDDVLFGQLATEAEHEEPPAKGGRAAAASCRGSPSATRARCAATSCPPMTRSTRSGRRGGLPAVPTPTPVATATGMAS